ncbi:zinc finger protein Stp3p [[Candida] jaroonii]|uniref:Zinc finger protein Stp3p n=1 Tax=[Candida] jaroonii TaxID=467808 RepID=A0ACA9Y465_9ASCO|nr:zinc finger protein Stp3p [[Candida] jaroonii]
MYLMDNKLPSIHMSQNRISLPSINNLNLPLNLPLPNQYTINHPPSSINITNNKEVEEQRYSLSPISPISPRFNDNKSPSSQSSQSSQSSRSSVSEIEDIKDKDEPDRKKRKKRQCPECKSYFSNLATHKSTHLNPNSRPHICKYCSRGFARPNDLFRHIKCHWKEIGIDKGQFKCPYKNHSSGDHCGHNSGIFSRCDTFKNHLKAIHFQYPNGTKKDQRSNSSGVCRMCQKEFKNVDDWLVNHLEKNQCTFANEYGK